MDTALVSSIVNTATTLASTQTSEAVNIAMLKEALNMQAATTSAMIDALQQALSQPALATSGTLGTQFNTYT
ncbi:hypothetical protein Ajs_3041 [Acidovorax sp. JS42]|nr:hypothetical protein Ajs_3041 [Acidovorax sp. JS42]